MNQGKSLVLFFILLIIGLICVVISWLGFNWGQTYSGTANVNRSECSVTVDLQYGEWETYWHKFYCESSFGGLNVCEAVDITKNGQCTAYYSFVKPQGK